jgi:hypothetical protein
LYEISGRLFGSTLIIIKKYKDQECGMGDYAEKAATEEERGSLLCNLLARMKK